MPRAGRRRSRKGTIAAFFNVPPYGKTTMASETARRRFQGLSANSGFGRREPHHRRGRPLAAPRGGDAPSVQLGRDGAQRRVPAGLDLGDDGGEIGGPRRSPALEHL